MTRAPSDPAPDRGARSHGVPTALPPAFDYASRSPCRAVDPGRRLFSLVFFSFSLASEMPLSGSKETRAASVRAREGQSAVFTMADGACEQCIETAYTAGNRRPLFQETAEYWRRWSRAAPTRGRWREMVHRSALALKLLTFEPTGAIVAAPTCSLPEVHRRRAQLGLSLHLDPRRRLHPLRAHAHRLHRGGRRLHAVARGALPRARARRLAADHVRHRRRARSRPRRSSLTCEGYRGSRPVRIGNGAYRQLQLDIYGELMDSVYLYNKYGAPIGYDLWQHLRRLVDWVCDTGKREDEGIWEVRGGRQHFVYSKADVLGGARPRRCGSPTSARSRPTASVGSPMRDAIYEEIHDSGWSDEREAFVQAYGCDSLDAANLIMPLVFFMSPDDPRMLGTLEQIAQARLATAGWSPTASCTATTSTAAPTASRPRGHLQHVHVLAGRGADPRRAWTDRKYLDARA